MMMDQNLRLDVLAIAAHPDGIELTVGGTLIKLARMGYKTGARDLTRGESGTRGTAEIRAVEVERAAVSLGLSVRENLDLGDARVWANEESRVKLVRVLRRLRPRVVFTQFWEDPHPDHAHTSQLVREACHVSGLAKYDRESGQERWRPSCVAYFLFPRAVAPSFIVDISETSERKWEAIRAHASQFFNPQATEPQSRVSAQAFLSEIEARDRYFGALIGVERGEAFLVREALNVDDPVALLTRPMNMYSYLVVGGWLGSGQSPRPPTTNHHNEHRHHSLPHLRRQRDRRLRVGPRVVGARPQRPFHQLRPADAAVPVERAVAVSSGRSL